MLASLHSGISDEPIAEHPHGGSSFSTSTPTTPRPHFQLLALLSPPFSSLNVLSHFLLSATLSAFVASRDFSLSFNHRLCRMVDTEMERIYSLSSMFECLLLDVEKRVFN